MNSQSTPRIGVLTYHNGPNFGGFLQAWHGVQAIRKLGYQAFAVNYLHPVHHETNQIDIPLRNLSSVKARAFWWLKKRGFRDIEREICEDPFVTDATKVPWMKYDALVVGSDIVWDYQQKAYGSDPAYFGMLDEIHELPIMSYAASCGPASPDGPFPSFVGEGLKRFAAIGVRDQATADLVRNASGFDSTLVVDPTWLNDDPEEDWGAPEGDFLFAYGSRIDDQLGPLLADFCKRQGWQLVSALTPCRWADKMYRSLTPFQWASLFRKAKATAICGTLHGTLFTMKYGKPFITISSPAVKPKLGKVMELTGQQFRVFEPGMVTKGDLELLQPEAAPLPAIPATWLQQSRDFLANGIERMLATR